VIRLIPRRGNIAVVSIVESLGILQMTAQSPEMKRLATIVARKGTLHETVVKLLGEEKEGDVEGVEERETEDDN
jgi:hypothetical protein